MSILSPFSPKAGGTVNLAAAAGAADVALDPNVKQVMVTNLGTQLVFVRFKKAGDTTAATVADAPVMANTQVAFTKSDAGPRDGHSLMSVVAPGGAGSTVYVTNGEGW